MNIQLQENVEETQGRHVKPIPRYDKYFIAIICVLVAEILIFAGLFVFWFTQKNNTVDIPVTAMVEESVVNGEEYVEEEVEVVEEESYTTSTSSYSEQTYTEGVLTRSGGVNYFNGRTETWYSQQVLPGGGLDIPGRHVADDGTIRDGDGYICVAASDLPMGTVVETSLGTGKVYDTGCDPGITDIYTNW